MADNYNNNDENTWSAGSQGGNTQNVGSQGGNTQNVGSQGSPLQQDASSYGAGADNGNAQATGAYGAGADNGNAQAAGAYGADPDSRNSQGTELYGNNNSQGSNPYGYGYNGQNTNPYGSNINFQGNPNGYNNWQGQPGYNNAQGDAYGYNNTQGQPGYNNPQGQQGYNYGPGGNSYGYNDPYGGYYHPNNGGYNSSSTGAVSAVSEAGRSLPFLIGTIGYSIYGLFTLIMLFMPKYSYGYYDTSANVGLTAGTLIGLIPTTIIIIGMWMFYISCSRDAVPSTTGITLNRGAIITNIVIICIASVLIIIGLLLLLATGSMTPRSYWGRNVYSMVMGLIVFIFIVIAIFLVMAIIYYVKLLKLTRIIRDTINSGKYCGCLPMYPLIINFVLAAFNLFSLFGVVTAGGVGYKIISLIAALALVASFVSTTLSLFSLRTRLEGMR